MKLSVECDPSLQLPCQVFTCKLDNPKLSAFDDSHLALPELWSKHASLWSQFEHDDTSSLAADHSFWYTQIISSVRFHLARHEMTISLVDATLLSMDLPLNAKHVIYNMVHQTCSYWEHVRACCEASEATAVLSCLSEWNVGVKGMQDDELLKDSRTIRATLTDLFRRHVLPAIKDSVPANFTLWAAESFIEKTKAELRILSGSLATILEENLVFGHRKVLDWCSKARLRIASDTDGSSLCAVLTRPLHDFEGLTSAPLVDTQTLQSHAVTPSFDDSSSTVDSYEDEDEEEDTPDDTYMISSVSILPPPNKLTLHPSVIDTFPDPKAKTRVVEILAEIEEKRASLEETKDLHDRLAMREQHQFRMESTCLYRELSLSPRRNANAKALDSSSSSPLKKQPPKKHTGLRRKRFAASVSAPLSRLCRKRNVPLKIKLKVTPPRALSVDHPDNTLLCPAVIPIYADSPTPARSESSRALIRTTSCYDLATEQLVEEDEARSMTFAHIESMSNDQPEVDNESMSDDQPEVDISITQDVYDQDTEDDYSMPIEEEEIISTPFHDNEQDDLQAQDVEDDSDTYTPEILYHQPCYDTISYGELVFNDGAM